LSLIVLVGIPGRPVNFSVYVKTIWLVGAGLMIALRRFVKPAGLRMAPTIALVMMVIYWGLLLIVHNQSIRNASSASIALNEQTKVMALPTPANPFVWTCIAETP